MGGKADDVVLYRRRVVYRRTAAAIPAKPARPAIAVRSAPEPLLVDEPEPAPADEEPPEPLEEELSEPEPEVLDMDIWTCCQYS